MRILIVDDSPTARAMTRLALTESGHELEEAASVAAARPRLAECQVAVVDMMMPDEDGIDKPVACVVPVAGRAVDPPALIDFCREGLASFKRPRAVVVVAELPKTATGKIRRNVIREQVRDVLRVVPST